MLIPSVRVMLSANVTGDAKARHHIRHRARHGLAPSLRSYGGTRRGGVASPLQRFAPVVPCRRPRRPRRSRASHAAPAPRQALAQAGCRVTPMQDRGSVVSRSARLLRSSTGSPQALSSSSTHGPPARQSRLRRVKSCDLPDSAKPREDGRPPHSVRHSWNFAPRRRNAADRRLSGSRAQERILVSLCSRIPINAS